MKNDGLRLTQPLQTLYLSFLAERYQELADQAARQQWTAGQYLARLIEGETQRRHNRPIVRRVAAARFPVIKTLEPFNSTWPKKVNQAQVQNLLRLAFLKDQARVGFIGGVGLGNEPGGERFVEGEEVFHPVPVARERLGPVTAVHRPVQVLVRLEQRGGHRQRIAEIGQRRGRASGPLVQFSR